MVPSISFISAEGQPAGVAGNAHYAFDSRSETDRYAAWAGVVPEPASLLERLDRSTTASLFQEQDFLNKQAQVFSIVADALDVAYEQIPQALEKARISSAREASADGWSEALYNYTGDVLLGTVELACSDYAARIADIEGVRRAALLTAEFRSRGIAPGEVEAALTDAQLRNPYTGEPFAWDAESSEVVFEGITPRGRSRYAFWY